MAVTKGLITLLLAANTKGMDGALGRTGKKLKGFRRTVAVTTKALGFFGGAFLIANIINKAAETIGKFDAAMVNLSAILRTTRKDIASLEAQAIKLGGATIFTANQIGELQTILARFGFDKREIEASTQSILDLAAAADIDLATASDAAASTLRAFGLDALEMGRVVDVMANSFTQSALTVETFGEAMKFAAPLAAAAGISIEETAAMLGILADNGLRGSIAGTSLRRIFTELATSGKSISSIFEEAGGNVEFMADALGFADDAVGKYALSSFVVLAKNADQIKKNTIRFGERNAAQEIAIKQLGTLKNKVVILDSAWEKLIITIEAGEGPMAKFFGGAVEGATSLLNLLSDTDTGVHGLQLTNEELLKLKKAGDAVGKLDLSNETNFGGDGALKGQVINSKANDHFIAFLEAYGVGLDEISEKQKTYNENVAEQKKILDKINDRNVIAVSDEQITLENEFNGLVKERSVVWNNLLSLYEVEYNWIKKKSAEEKKAEKEGLRAVQDKKDAALEEAKYRDDLADQYRTEELAKQGYHEETIVQLDKITGYYYEITRLQTDWAKGANSISLAGLATSGGASSPATDNDKLKADSDAATDLLKDQIDTYSEWADTVTSALAQGAQSWEDYRKNLGGTLFDMVADYALYLVKFQAQKAFENAINNTSATVAATTNAVQTGASLGPFGFLAIPALAALALGLVSTAIGNAKATPFAQGGVVSGPTYAMVGEYGNARNNPEVIAPLDKLKGMLGDVGGGGGTYEFVLKNRTLVAALKREQARQDTYGA